MIPKFPVTPCYVKNPSRPRGLGTDPTVYFGENLFRICKSPQKFGFSLKQQQQQQQQQQKKVFFDKLVGQNFIIL